MCIEVCDVFLVCIKVEEEVEKVIKEKIVFVKVAVKV